MISFTTSSARHEGHPRGRGLGVGAPAHHLGALLLQLHVRHVPAVLQEMSQAGDCPPCGGELIRTYLAS